MSCNNNLAMFDTLQAIANTGRQGRIVMSSNDKVENVTIKMGGKAVDMNDPNIVPIIKTAEMIKDISELERIERETPLIVDDIEQSTQFSEQQKPILKRNEIAEKYAKFAITQRKIESNYAGYDVKSKRIARYSNTNSASKCFVNRLRNTFVRTVTDCFKAKKQIIQVIVSFPIITLQRVP